MAENKYLIKNPVLVDGMVNLYSFNVDSVDYYLVPSSASEDIWCIGFIANVPTSGHPIVADGTPLAQPIVLSNIRGDVNVYCDHSTNYDTGYSEINELVYNGKTYYYSTENLYPMGFDTSAIINNIIPIHTEESFSDYESAALKLIELYKAEGGLMPGEKNEEPSEYPTSWIKKQIDGNYQKSFTYAHAKTVYTDYANKKTLADKLVEIDTSLDGKANLSHTHTKSQITDFPTLGTASAKDVASSGNASTNQIVMGNDTRLTDARKASDVSAWAKASVKPSYSKSEVGLGNVDNTSDTNKPVSTAQQTAIDTAYANANKYTDKKVADLIGSAPETMDTLEEVAAAIQENKDIETALNAAIGTKANQSELDTHTDNSTIHITASERTKWNAAKTHADSTHARTDATKVEKSTTNGNIKINGTETTVYTHPSGTNPHGTTKSDVGLDNVGNFKAVSTVANQGLTDTEKSNARTNIGAGTSSFSGSYNDLTNKPTIPTNNNQLTNGAGYITSSGTAKTISDTLPISKGGTGQTTAINAANTLINSLEVGDTVPTDDTNIVVQGVGNYSNKFYRKPVSLLWNYIKSKLATVATSGSYNDLSNKPTIPSVGNGTVTIKQAGTSKGTFTMNQTGNTTIELTDNNTTYGVATSSALGLVKSGTDITVDSSGNVSVNDDSHNHVISNVDGLQSALDGKAASSHTHNYAGSSSAGGSATSAVKLDSSAGSATQPVYFSGGKPVACTYTLGKSVPSDAVFTDTVYDDTEVKESISAQSTEIMDKIDAILDPDNEVVEGQTVTTYDPGFVVGKILSYTTGEVEDNAQYIAALNYTPIADGATYRMMTSASSTFRLIVYDSNKKIVKAWNQGTDGAWRDNGGEFTLPTGMDIKYIRCYSETTTIPTSFDIVNVSTNASIFKIVSGGATRFSKLAFKNQYALKPYVIDDDPNMHGLKILRDNDCNEEFSIVEITAPSKTPYESTLTLMNSGEKTVQFVDLSSMRYDESTQGTIELVCQSRGANTPLPEFRINFNNGDGHGRVQKFVVRPDAIPIKMTSNGLLVRKNNDYTNESTDDDWYEFNFKDVLNNIEEKADKSETTVNLLKPTLGTITQNGITCTNNGDGTYTLDGTATGLADFTIIVNDDNPIKVTSKVKVLGTDINYDKNKYKVFCRVAGGSYKDCSGEGTIVESDITYVFIRVNEGAIIDNVVIKPMITTNLNATYNDFVPYTGDTGSLNGDVADLRENVDNLVELGEDITD